MENWLSGDHSQGVNTPIPVLVSRDSVICEQVGAVSAAAGVQFEVVAEVGSLRSVWTRAPVVLIGSDLANWVVSLQLAPRGNLHLVSLDPESLVKWSGTLRASGLLLPENSSALVAILEEIHSAGEAARWVQVMGSGGVGASTFAAALAIRTAARDLRTALVELDPLGGGIDLIFGAEREPGWRWPDLASATGHVKSLDQLPNVLGVDLLSTHPSDEQLSGLPAQRAVSAVLDSLSRSHQVLILDGGDAIDQPNGQIVLVVAASVRATLAARSRVRTQGLFGARLVVREAPGWRLDPDQVSEAVGLGCIGVLKHDKGLPSAMESGDPPGRGRNGYTKHVETIMEQLLGEEFS